MTEERSPLTASELEEFERDPRNRTLYGDTLIHDENDSTLLCGFLNVNGLGQDKWKEKNNSLFKFLFNTKFDVMGLSEINLHWSSLTPSNSWEERVQGRWESLHSSICYNQEDPVSSAWQPGGCIQLSTNRMAHRVISSGKDPSGLGRWCWTRYRGRHDVTLRIITAYRPGGSSSSGPKTVFWQNQRYLDRIKDD